MVVGLGYKVGYVYMAGYNVRNRQSVTDDNSTVLVLPSENGKGLYFTVSIDYLRTRCAHIP